MAERAAGRTLMGFATKVYLQTTHLALKEEERDRRKNRNNNHKHKTEKAKGRGGTPPDLPSPTPRASSPHLKVQKLSLSEVDFAQQEGRPKDRGLWLESDQQQGGPLLQETPSFSVKTKLKSDSDQKEVGLRPRSHNKDKIPMRFEPMRRPALQPQCIDKETNPPFF